jgi:GWxTD domain-containing protein
MFGRRVSLLAFAAFLLAARAGSGPSPAPKNRAGAWLEREVALLVTPAERDAFSKLASDSDQDAFIEEFWRQRDPTPGTAANEFRDEHARRLLFADEHFGGGGAPAGRLTDRGKALIAFGPPLDVQTFAKPEICPVEIWYYLRDVRAEGPTLVRLLFYQEYGADEYKLYDPLVDGPKRLVPFPERWQDEGRGGPAFPPEWTAADAKAYRILTAAVSGELAEAAFSSFPGSTSAGDPARSAALIAELKGSPGRRVRDDYAAGFDARRGPAVVDYALNRVGNACSFGVLRDADGRFIVSYALAPDLFAFDTFQGRYFAGLRTRIKATDAAGAVAFQSETFRALDATREELRALAQSPFEVHGSFPLGSGAYAVEIRLENTVSRDFTTASFEVVVPGGPGPRLGPLVLSRNAVRDTAGGAGGAFRCGPVRLFPSVDGLFAAKDVLFLFMQADGLSPDPEASLECSVLGGEKVLRTQRRSAAASAGRLDLLEEVALEGLAPGDYLVKAALLDKGGREILSRSAPFKVTAKFLPGRWVFAPDGP